MFNHTINSKENNFIKEEISKEILSLTISPDHKYNFKTPSGGLDLTDLSFAEYFIHRYGDKIKYNNQRGKWYIWNNKLWVEDKAKLHLFVKRCIKDMFKFAIELEDKEERNKFLRFCNKCESRISIDNMLNLASREELVCKNECDFDCYPDLLNCSNVIIDFSGNEFKIINYNPNLLIRQFTNVIYDKDAKCPLFLSNLDIWFNKNDNMINFIQQALGYSLTGRTSEDCLFFIYGTGRNGKSTFAEILKLLFGNYYHKANIELILQQRNVNVRNDIADLKGKRLVVTSEIDQGKKLSENLVKDLTGGDDVTARHLYQEQITFKPECKFWIYGNHKPIFTGTDEGIRRRIKLIPFNNTIPDDNFKSRDIIINEAKAELSGILNWALEGFNIFRKNGKLIFPKEVKDATTEYFNEMDHIQNFLNDCIINDINSKIKVKDLYENYKNYSEENGDRPISNRAFSQALKEKGYINRPGNKNAYYWIGISLTYERDSIK